ncbi:MAG: type I-U CRISPR-associated helicase/endonuclease Cas3 [Polyangiaceae bacterium]|nr:type I-U CRISPR-associated helicase/endonuclease Cas3 [Polyangiaceae bacterium]
MNAKDFISFFKAIHGYSPFPWQARLAETVATTDGWPDVLALPTGSGKTACIDIALFHWLVAASCKEPERAARRIAFVVDRRIIVDEAAERARKIKEAIRGATGGMLAEVRDLLEANGSDGIDVFTLRGGVARERNLVHDPLTVSVVLSTVDQIGSRLLFRGYGVSDTMRSLHAGLFGFDTLLLLDEAHISEPFLKTMQGIVREQNRSQAVRGGPQPLRVVQLSATPGKDKNTGAPPFALDDKDRADPVLQPRLHASKSMRLWAVEKRDELPAKLTALIVDELSAPPLSPHEAPRIGVIVNRVVTAREVFESLTKKLKDRADVELLIGRVRPIDRDKYVKEILTPKLRAQKEPRGGDRPVVVVATQTIEVGADFDFHALYTEAASYSALKQRVGRLNRLGVRDGARGGIVLVRADQDDDPIYGHTISSTWEFLQRHAKGDIVDLGISAPISKSESTPAMIPASPDMQELSPSLLGLLVQTCPEPADEPDVTEFLHGITDRKPEISVVWRDGLFGDDGQIDIERAREIFDVLPPLSAEAMSLPYFTFLQWAAQWEKGEGKKIVDTSDMEGDVPTGKTNDRTDAKVLVVSGRTGKKGRRRQGVDLLSASHVLPGSLIVLPSSRGGADKYGFDPTKTDRVQDLSLIARAKSGRGRALVWTPEIAKTWLSESNSDLDARELTNILKDPDATRADAWDALVAWLDEHAGELRDDVQEARDKLRSRPRVEWLVDKNGRFGIVLHEGRAKAADLVEGGSLQRTVPVTLSDHLEHVSRLAERYAKSVGLEDALVAALKLAGQIHDLGKADPRFQRRLGASGDTLMAKSETYDKTVPRGERHEVYSVAVMDQYPDFLQHVGEHRDLLRYLVGTHHGHGRALQPYVDDMGIAFHVPYQGETLNYHGRPALHGLAAGWDDLFVRLNREYGPWMLAYLETILRLADHRSSAQEVIEYQAKEAKEEP